MRISLAGTGAYILIVTTVLKLLGVEFEPGSVEAAVNGIVAAIGLVMAIIGTLRRKDLKGGLIRRYRL